MAKKQGASAPAIRVYVPELVDPSELNPAAYNPNKMSPKEFEALKGSILEHGFAEALVVQRDGMCIIAGHHRHKAIRELSIELNQTIPKLPAFVLDVDSDVAKKLNLKLQHIHGGPDARMLGELLIDIFKEERPTAEETEALGIEFDDAGRYMRIADPEYFPSQDPEPEGDEPKEFGRSVTLSLEFEDIKLRDAVKKILTERASVEKKKSGHIVAALVGAKVKKTKRVA